MKNLETLQIYQDYAPQNNDFNENDPRKDVLGGEIWYN